MARGGVGVGGPYRGKQGAVHFRGRGRGGFKPRGRGSYNNNNNNSARNNASDSSSNGVALQTDDAGTQLDDTFENAKVRDEIDERLGFKRWEHGAPKTGWLVNMHATLIKDNTSPGGRAAVDYYFIEEDGAMFKSTILYEPYFLIACKKGMEGQVEEWLLKKYEEQIVRLERTRKEDLKLPNHLLGYRRTFVSLFFRNSNDMYTVRRDLLPLVQKNMEALDAIDAYAEVVNGDGTGGADVEMAFTDEYGHMAEDEDQESGYVSKASRVTSASSPSDHIIDIREYDIPYYLRVAIDKEIRVGLWYTVTSESGEISLSIIRERVERAEPVVMAFDIETTKAPLKFPDQQNDQIMMISYMIDGQGYLITNREIVSEDIEDFEYTPKAEYEGPFTIFNEENEAELVRRFFEHFREAKPTVIATYNGDSFDFPFVEARATIHGIDMLSEIGFAKDREGEYKSRTCVHMDCYRWVKRDSYLPQGSQGLKAVTVAKLGYNPIELDPELMTPYAQEQPHILSQYSVSDAVATYYLYMKYVHPFVFSLCNIIPLNPDEVLRKGSGTLCETLLMVEAYRGEIIMPNRHVEGQSSMYEGHLLESETYVGGHVEALEAGVFRSDIPVDFKVAPEACQKLIDDLDLALRFSLTEEGKISLDDVENYQQVKDDIQRMLEELRDNPIRLDTPLIYHLDVAAMYPNIMLSNRLQPDSVVTEAACAACDYNRPGKQCDRRMTWAWRGEFFPAKLDEFKMVKNALEGETFPPLWKGKPPRKFQELKPSEQTTLLHKRLGDYSRKVYKKTHETKIVKKEAIICQRENPFYIDTVREFRDRRYTYKGLHKNWKKNLDKANEGGSVIEIVEAKKMIVLYDSLQLAHKCILNSFYGYVMRKGARWHSMEMAGITCLTGASIIQMARKLVEQIGRPLELDTDGIWCMLPSTFPDNFSFKLKNGKKFDINYPCTMLNHLVHADFTNDQYHELVDKERGTYQVKSENSIFFELDGPYRAMILPSSKEEDKLLKKRYAVFNEDGSLAELKGFEVKRRGELQLIKIFQTQIFEQFLLGTTLQECYAEVATVANQWLDILSTKGASLSDEELVDLIAENRSMSRTLSEYAGQKSTSISTAKRLAEFLGDNMVKDKGLSCRFIVSAKPIGAPVTERAVPVAIFSAEPSIKRHFLRKWLKDNGLTEFELRSVLDWDYYIERLGSVVQKLITIPAAMQKVANPVPRIRHPEWLLRRVANLEDKFKQHKLEDMFTKMRARAPLKPIQLIEEDSEMTEETAASETPAEPVKEVAAKKTKPQPDINADYPGWLRFQKKLWKKRREERRASASTGISRQAGNLGVMFSKQTISLASHTWEIIQISDWPNGRPGEFKLWLLIRDSLQAVKLRIPRIFYLNFTKLDDVEQLFPRFCQFEMVNRTLPRGQKAAHLISCTTDEVSYRENEASMSMLMNHPDVDGVYETQVPHILRALTRLGNKCNPDTRSGVSLSRGLDQGFHLHELATPTAMLNKRRYLDGGLNLKYGYLYHSNQDSRHLVCLVLPSGEARMYVVDKGRNREVVGMERYYQEAKAALDTRRKMESRGKLPPSLFDYPDQIKIEVTYHAEVEAVYRHLSKELNALHTRRQGPTILTICSARARSFYEASIPNLQHFPVVMEPSSKVDNTYPTRLMWQNPAARRMLQHYLRIGTWMNEKLEIAHRADVPIGNLEADAPIFLADIDYARRLSKADILLWWSDMPRPDLGGRQQDANSQGLSDEPVNPEIVRSGAYTNACVEVAIRDLAIDAVMQSALVYELEGSEAGKSIGFSETSHNLDEYAKGTAHAAVILGDSILPTQIFSIIKAMVKTWWSEDSKGDGAHARRLMDHFWRWVTSPSSALYDPALQKFIHGLMRKTFSQLLAELRRLGSDIIYADFNRIMLATSKPSPGAAYAYANYVVSSLTSRELFKFINLRIIDFWSLFIQMDSSNFAGMICKDPLNEDDVQKPKSGRTEMNWLIQALLPPAVQPQFEFLVGKFISGLRENKLKMSDSRTPLRILPNASQTQPDLQKKAEQDAARAFIQTDMTRLILKAVDYLKKGYSDSLVSDDDELRMAYQFPQFPGSTLTTQKVVLEFVKAVCAVFALAKELAPEVAVLRKNVLDLVGSREFAVEAAFKLPSASFKIATVCSHCQLARDLDLCKDVDLLLNVHTTADSIWPCPACKHSLDKSVVESKLIVMMQRSMASNALQDLRCQRCNAIKASNLSQLCDCSGAYKLEKTVADHWKKIRTVREVAAYYNLEMALEFADDCLRFV